MIVERALRVNVHAVAQLPDMFVESRLKPDVAQGAPVQWGYSQSVRIIKELMTDRMYPLTLAGLDDAMRELTRKR